MPPRLERSGREVKIFSHRERIPNFSHFNMDINEIKKQIISAFMPFEPDKIILFGSITRDDWDEYSDVDVIVVYETDKSFLERLKELYMSWDIPKAIDILAYTPAEFVEMAADSYFIQDVVTDGELIYERS